MSDLPTLALTTITLGLVVVTLWQLRLNRRALEMSIRPLLAEAEVSPAEPEFETVTFGAPGRESVQVQPGALYQNHDGSKLSVPFRNIGAGVAVITYATSSPKISGSVEVTRKFVPIGEHVRVNISSMPASNAADGTFQPDQWWAMRQRLEVCVHYTDAAGRQQMISQATFKQAATRGPWIDTIAIYRKGQKKPIAIGNSTM